MDRPKAAILVKVPWECDKRIKLVSFHGKVYIESELLTLDFEC